MTLVAVLEIGCVAIKEFITKSSEASRINEIHMIGFTDSEVSTLTQLGLELYGEPIAFNADDL